jgi:Cupin domain
MKVNILREIPWFGGNYFHPISFDENSFKLEGCLRAGKSVPTHYHKHFDEFWTVVQGTPIFISGNEKFIRQPGETFSVPKLIPHSIVNNTTEDIILITEMRPAADMAKMMSIIAGLQDDKEKYWMFKYLFLEKKAGLKEFSTPTDILVKLITVVLMPLTMLIGTIAGWDKLINKYI